MYTLSCNDTPQLTFFAITKNASSAIVHNLQLNDRHRVLDMYWHTTDENQHPSLFHLSEFQKQLLAKDRFCVVQHPYDRFASAWRYLHRDYARKSNELEFKSELDFAQWLVDHIKAITETSSCGAFFAPQWYWAKHCNIVLNKSSLDNDYEELMTKYFGEADYSLRKVNVSKQITTRLTDKHKLLVQEFWHDDFEYLGFEY